jgi:predicted DNA-binding transcriptional regulator AlpA
MTAEELARELRVDERQVRRLDSEGKIPKALTIGTRSKRWRRDEIVRWLASPKPDGTLPTRSEWQAMEEQRSRDEIRRPRCYGVVDLCRLPR